MKKQLLTFLLLGLTTLTAFSQVPSYVPTNGLVGYWPFNGNAQDESGNLNHGTVYGANLTADRNGVANKAYSFDGVSNYILVNNSLSLQNINDITISAWININGYFPVGAGYFPILNKSQQSNASPLYGMFIQPNNIELSLNCNIGNINNTLNQNEWTHIAVSIKTVNSIKKSIFFINGLQIGEVNTYLISICNNPIINDPLSFGRDYPGACEYANGQIDDVSIFNRALSQQEITALYSGIPTCTTPTATITPQSTTTFCQNGSVVLDASIGSGNTYEWYKDGNLINGSIASSYTAIQSGSYTVKVINGSCNATSTPTTVTVNPNPTATITSQSNTTFCQNGSVVLNASTGAGNTYEWYKDGNLISGSIANSYTAIQSGSYTVKVINGSCNATSTPTTVTVNPNPTATITPQSTTTFCQNGSVVLNASTVSGNTYEWYKDGNLISGSIANSYTAIQSGSYTVKVLNGSCNATSAQTTVTVNPNPIATITPQSTTTFCQNGSVVLNASTGTGNTYEWYKNGTIINGSITSSYTATQSGSFTVKVINGSCNATSVATNVTVNPNPTATITAVSATTFCQGGSVVLNASIGSGNTYEWYKDGNLISGSIANSYTAIQSGSYTVKVINGACNSTSSNNSVSVLNCAGIDENEISKIKFYPNPTKDVLFIDNGNYQAMNGYSIKIVSLTGAVVYNQPITSQQVQISMNQFATKGLYIAQILDSNNAIVDSKKIVLE